MLYQFNRKIAIINIFIINFAIIESDGLEEGSGVGEGVGVGSGVGVGVGVGVGSGVGVGVGVGVGSGVGVGVGMGEPCRQANSLFQFWSSVGGTTTGSVRHTNIWAAYCSAFVMIILFVQILLIQAKFSSTLCAHKLSFKHAWNCVLQVGWVGIIFWTQVA